MAHFDIIENQPKPAGRISTLQLFCALTLQGLLAMKLLIQELIDIGTRKHVDGNDGDKNAQTINAP